MTLIWNIIQSVITILEIRVCVWMMEKFAEPRYSGKKQKIVVWIVTLGVGGLYAYNRWVGAYYSRTMMLTILSLLCISTIWIFIYNRGIAAFVITNYLLVGGLVDLIIMSITELIMQRPGIFAYIDYVNDGYRISVMLISKVLLFILCWEIQRKINKRVIYQLCGKKITVLWLSLSTIEYLGVHLLTDILNFNQRITNDFFIRIVFCLIVVILLIIILEVIFLYYDKKDQLKQKDIFMESLNCENQRMIRLYREREKMYHDFKNHLFLIDTYVQSGDLEQYQKYINVIKRPFLDKPVEWRTGHSIIDLILNYKIAEARKKKIRVSCKIYGYMDFEIEITDEEMCSLLANLWDNAIEACERLKKQESWIEFQMHIRTGKFLIEISNPYEAISQDKYGVFQTSKADKRNHGIGMRTIRDITERHHGYFNCILYDQTFKMEVMICNKQ